MSDWQSVSHRRSKLYGSRQFRIYPPLALQLSKICERTILRNELQAISVALELMAAKGAAKALREAGPTFCIDRDEDDARLVNP